MPDNIACFLGSRSGRYHRPLCARGRGGFKEYPGLVVRLKKDLNAPAQLRILAAGLVEVGGALFGRQRLGGIEDALLAARFGGRRRHGLLIVFHRGQHNQNLRG